MRSMVCLLLTFVIVDADAFEHGCYHYADNQGCDPFENYSQCLTNCPSDPLDCSSGWYVKTREDWDYQYFIAWGYRPFGNSRWVSPTYENWEFKKCSEEGDCLRTFDTKAFRYYCKEVEQFVWEEWSPSLSTGQICTPWELTIDDDPNNDPPHPIPEDYDENWP